MAKWHGKAGCGGKHEAAWAAAAAAAVYAREEEEEDFHKTRAGETEPAAPFTTEMQLEIHTSTARGTVVSWNPHQPVPRMLSLRNWNSVMLYQVIFSESVCRRLLLSSSVVVTIFLSL